MLALIVAFSKNRVIGKNGKIPWNIPDEQSRFRELTTGNVVIMGRKTYEEIGHPLPDRFTIVISNTVNYNAKNCTTVTSFEKALELATKLGCQLKDTTDENLISENKKDCFIAGGEQLYTAAISIVQKMYITEVEIEVEGDAFFPKFDENKFVRHVEKKVTGHIPYTYLTYTRI